MKPTTFLLITCLLLEILSPHAAAADAVHVQSVGSRNQRGLEEYNADDVAERLIRSFYKMDVRVMTRGNLDVSGLEARSFAFVVQRSAGTRSTVTGTITQVAQDGITLIGAARKKILYAEIDTLVVSEDLWALETWQNQADGRLVLMSRGNLDLSRLRSGWHAYVVYKSGDGKRAQAAEIVDVNEGQLLMRSGYGVFGKRRPIQRVSRIIFIVAAKHRSDIVAWQKAIQVIQNIPEIPRIRFRERSIAGDGTKNPWTVGRLVGVDRDTLIIGVGLSRRDVYRVPTSLLTDLELNTGRTRNTTRGLMIGIVVGTALAAAMYEEVHDPGYYHPDVAFFRAAQSGILSSVVLVSTLAGSIIGYNIKTDRWVSVPRKGLNLSFSPTRDQAIGAALSFSF